MALNVPLIYFTNEYNDTWGDDNHDNEESDDDGGGGEGEMMGSKSNGKQIAIGLRKNKLHQMYLMCSLLCQAQHTR